MNLQHIRVGLWVVVALLAVGLFVTSSGLFGAGGAGNRNGDAEDTFKLGGPFNLTDQYGQPITEAAFEGHPIALFFGFLNCPEICPTTVYDLTNWMDELGPDGETIKAYFVTVDPERDTVELVDNFLSGLGGRVVGITGDPQELAKMRKAWRVYAKRVELGDGDYTMDHTASIFLMRPDGTFQGTIAYGENPETAKEKLKMLSKS